MKKLIANKRGEGYIPTTVKIIIAVVIGGLLLGGLYLIFAGDNGVISKADDSIFALFNTGSDLMYKLEDGKLLRFYDEDNSREVKITGMEEGGRVTKYLTMGEGEKLVHLVTYTNSSSGSRLCYSLDGKEWVPCISATSITLLVNDAKTYGYVRCDDGRTYNSVNGVVWRLTSGSE